MTTLCPVNPLLSDVSARLLGSNRCASFPRGIGKPLGGQGGGAFDVMDSGLIGGSGTVDYECH